jgi:hypothetical protein
MESVNHLKSLLQKHARIRQTLQLYQQLQSLDVENAQSLQALSARTESQIAVVELELARMVRQ